MESKEMLETNTKEQVVEKDIEQGESDVSKSIDVSEEKEPMEDNRKKLLQSLHPNKRQLRMWDPELIALKQRALVSQIYGEHIEAPFWHPNMLRPQRPYWARLAPSSAGQLSLIKLQESQSQSRNYSYNMRR